MKDTYNWEKPDQRENLGLQNPDKENTYGTDNPRIKFDEREDPLEINRINKEGSPMGQTFNDVEGIVTDEDADQVKSHEERWWTDSEDIEKDFLDTLIDENASQEIIDSIDQLREVGEEGQAEYEQDHEEANLLEYSTEQFILMERSARFKDSIDVLNRMQQERPLFLKNEQNEVAMNDEQIARQVSLWQEYKNNKEQFDQEHRYRFSELSFMHKCAAWDYFLKRAMVNEKHRPQYANGTPIPDEDMVKLAQSYHEFRQSNPDHYAELKHRKGEWKKENMAWSEESFKGKQQWTSYSHNDSGEIKYISEIQPGDASGDFYFTIKGKVDNKRDEGGIIWVDIKYPKSEDVLKSYRLSRRR